MIWKDREGNCPMQIRAKNNRLTQDGEKSNIARERRSKPTHPHQVPSKLTALQGKIHERMERHIKPIRLKTLKRVRSRSMRLPYSVRRLMEHKDRS